MASRPCDSQPPELLKRHSGVTLDWRRPGPETARAAAAAVATALGSAICGACSTQLLPADFSAQSALSGLAAVRRILSRSWPTPPIAGEPVRGSPIVGVWPAATPPLVFPAMVAFHECIRNGCLQRRVAGPAPRHPGCTAHVELPLSGPTPTFPLPKQPLDPIPSSVRPGAWSQCG